ncbi:MAG: arginine--tRNA ligase [Candidatus Margulisbacteria bacterium]|nr:arginine--tRNA ligase [Candidatus Margulisiibacteriota bacterium]
MLQATVESLLNYALLSLGIEKAQYKVDIPPKLELGDYATNAAILAARQLKKNPFELAQIISDKVKELDKEKLFSKIEIAKPGFINFFFNESFIQQSTAEIIAKDHAWGQGTRGKGQGSRILLEFVSANPTGPLHVGHGRWAVVGDCIARILKAAGYKVESEFYVNNIGNQVEKLWASVEAARAGQPTPENGYGGAYIKEVKGDNKEAVLQFILGEQKETLGKLGVRFDRFFNESELHEKGEVKEAVSRLEQRHKTIVEGGAIWFKSMEMGDDKNRVLVREDGNPTYLAADLAYHLDKFSRGYDRLINIWGTDHHGYVKRLKAAVEAMGLPAENLEIIIGQLVTLYRGNEPVRMSKRTGEMVTLQEVIEEIGADATRFFFAASDVNSHLDFDLELAKKQSSENPVYYVQYAHARICSIIKKAEGQGARGKGQEDLSGLTEPAERELMLKLLSFPDVVESAARLRHPHRITEYGKEVATVFHHFYEKCRVLGNPARLALVDASRITLRNVLELLGINAPEAM